MTDDAFLNEFANLCISVINTAVLIFYFACIYLLNCDSQRFKTLLKYYFCYKIFFVIEFEYSGIDFIPTGEKSIQFISCLTAWHTFLPSPHSPDKVLVVHFNSSSKHSWW